MPTSCLIITTVSSCQTHHFKSHQLLLLFTWVPDTPTQHVPAEFLPVRGSWMRRCRDMKTLTGMVAADLWVDLHCSQIFITIENMIGWALSLVVVHVWRDKCPVWQACLRAIHFRFHNPSRGVLHRFVCQSKLCSDCEHDFAFFVANAAENDNLFSGDVRINAEVPVESVGYRTHTWTHWMTSQIHANHQCRKYDITGVMKNTDNWGYLYSCETVRECRVNK